MENITLKNSDLKVSRLCFGGCPMGGHGWGAVSKDDLVKAIEKAIDIGVNFFDSADAYGLGEAETILGQTLIGKRSKAVIGTKFGVRVEWGKTFYDNSEEWINTAVENSLKRLQTDYIDLYQIHYRDGKTPIEVVVGTLEKLKQSGKIRHYGLSNINNNDMNELSKYKGSFACTQSEFSLACRKNEDEISLLSEKLGLTPLTWGSLGQGILTGKYDKNSKFAANDRRSREIYVNFHGEKKIKNLEIVEKLRQISEEINKPISAIAIRWILDYIPNSIVIAGIKNVSQLKHNSDALDWNLDKKYINELEKISR
jgi:aryl-alcohol dehydrogenase-like predicted oxidoreductase